MPRKTLHEIENDASITVSCLRGEQVVEVSALFTEIVLSLPYYNEEAKSSEIEKYCSDSLERMVATDADCVQVACVDERIVGFCFSDIDDGLIWLSWFAVKSDYRRRGIGASLLKALDDRAKRAGAHKIWCDCRTSNVASRGTLVGSGYREICVLHNHWYGQDFLLWERSVI